MPEAARYSGCSYRHFLKLIYGGEIPSYMADGHRWADQEDIDAYSSRCEANQGRTSFVPMSFLARSIGSRRCAARASAGAGSTA
jgi:excisionase family DNA binding protein